MKALIHEGRTIDQKDKERLKNVSQKIEKMQQIMEEFKGIKSISNIKFARKKTFTRKLLDENDEVITSRKGTANTFARGCMTTQKLKVNKERIKIANENTEDETENERPKDERESIPEFTEQELQTAIGYLQKRKIW